MVTIEIMDENKSNMVTVEIDERSKDENENDEITRFITRRYVSSCEAYWRIMEFPIVMITPAVLQLPLHLEHEQPVIYEPTQEGAIIALQKERKNDANTILSNEFI